MKKILLVEDDAIYRQLLVFFLREEPYVLFEAESPQHGIAILDADREIRVIVLDLSFPDDTGTVVLDYMQRCGRECRVIILTGHEELLIAEDARQHEVFAYLPKGDAHSGQAIRFALRQAFQSLDHSARAKRSSVDLIPTPPMRVERVSRGKSSLRVLIVDRDVRSLRAMGEALSTHFDVVLTTSPEEAARRVTKQHFALAILDMNLDDEMSGLDLLSRLRRAAPNLRAIVLAEQPDYVTAFESGRRGALNYVEKGDSALTDKVIRALDDRGHPIKVFLSYEKTDRSAVGRLFEKLMVRGFLPWMDRKSIGAGKLWEPEIQHAIEEADYFIFFLSSNSIFREGTMRKEVNQALEKQRGLRPETTFFIPVRLEECEVVEPFKKFQYVDLFRKDGFDKLLRAISSAKGC